MNTEISHELMQMPDWNFPVRIFSRETDSGSKGCFYHWHEQLEFFFVKRGSLQLMLNGEVNMLNEGEIAVINCHYPHRSISFSDNTFHYCIQFDFSILSSGAGYVCEKFVLALRQNRMVFTGFIGKDPEIASYLNRIIEEHENMDEGYELSISACIYNIITRLIRKYTLESRGYTTACSTNRDQYIVATLLSNLSKNYSSKLSLSLLARDVGVSVSHMCRIFKKNTGITIVEYANQLRCYRAKLLLSSGYSVIDAAFEVGYTDSNYFSRIFKSIFGTSPSNF